MALKLVGLLHVISHNIKETCIFNLSLDAVSSILYERKPHAHRYFSKLLLYRVTLLLTDFILKQRSWENFIIL